MLNTLFSKFTKNKRNIMDYLPPMVTYERSYWYNKRWESMANADDKDPNSHAVPTLCLWCGKMTPAYPLCERSGGTSCHECDRTVDESYKDWIYLAEFSDGCYYTLYKNGFGGSAGSKHAPHQSFVRDNPVLEMINPLLPEEYSDELLSFFRECYHSNSRKKYDENNEIWNIIENMPEREYPHRHIDWIDVGRNDPFSEDILYAPMKKFREECKERDIHTDSGNYKSFKDVWENSSDSNWMAHLLGDVYRKEIFGNLKMLTAMINCCEFILEDIKNPLLKSLVVRGIMPSIRGIIYCKTTEREDGTRVIGSDYEPVIGDQLDNDKRNRLLAYARTMYYCRDGLGSLNENNSEQMVVGAISDAIQESLNDSYQPNLGIVLASICNNFYGSPFPKKDRLKKCADVLRSHFSAEFMAEVMTNYKLRGED